MLDNAIHDELRSMGAKSISNTSSLGLDSETNFFVYTSNTNADFTVNYYTPVIKIHHLKGR